MGPGDLLLLTVCMGAGDLLLFTGPGDLLRYTGVRGREFKSGELGRVEKTALGIPGDLHRFTGVLGRLGCSGDASLLTELDLGMGPGDLLLETGSCL